MKRFIIEVEDDFDANAEELKNYLMIGQFGPVTSVRQTSIAPDEFVEAAIERHVRHSTDEIEIDSSADMSEGGDGVWINAWVFVPGLGSAYVDPELDEETEG